jgi:hypothetical protein
MHGKWEFYFLGELARKVGYKDGEPTHVEILIQEPSPPPLD